MAAVAHIRRLPVYGDLHPEFWIRLARGHRARVFHDPSTAEYGENLIIKPRGTGKIIGADRQVRKNARVVAGHGLSPN